jgi:hypothetical protein
MKRYQVVEWSQASDARNAEEYAPWDGDDDLATYLLDNKTNEIVFCDRMEPEDATLDRDLAPLVELLNRD